MVLCYFGEEDLGDLPSNLSLVTNHRAIKSQFPRLRSTAIKIVLH